MNWKDFGWNLMLPKPDVEKENTEIYLAPSYYVPRLLLWDVVWFLPRPLRNNARNEVPVRQGELDARKKFFTTFSTSAENYFSALVHQNYFTALVR